MTSQFMTHVLLGSIFVAACAPDDALRGYDVPGLTSDENGGSGGSASGGSGSSMTPGDPSAMAMAGGMPSSMSPPSMGGTPMGGSIGGSSMGGSSKGGSTSGPSTGGSSMGGSSGAPTGGMPADPKCDLSGRWLVVQRSVEEGLSVQQALRNWMYFEFSQSGQDVTATRGLDCGFDVVPLSAIAGAADLHKAWPKITANNPMAGRKATIKPSESGCTVSFPSYISVYGSTVAYYKDPSHALPSPTEQAMGSTPGWEDWDADGNPGVTYNLSGIASGQVFYSSRQTNIWSGSIGQTGMSFILPLVPKHENDQLGYNGSPFLTTQSTLAADKSLHFAQFARLDATQATGDDTATCNAVRMLADTLAPKGNEKPF